MLHKEFEQYRRDVIKAAKDLLYSDEVIEKLEAAESEAMLTNIMKTARLNI